ncbi:conjugal transfer protein TraF, partial (plasmid) [Vibrio parahaemolyticus]
MKKTVTIAFGLLLALGWYATGYRLNLTPSYPLGLYQLSKTNQYQQGDLVVFCPP